jgi:hypothetical protein
MNALVEDQLVRIRRALDSDEARGVCDKRFKKNRIYFGRYTGLTCVTGFDVHPRQNPNLIDSDDYRETFVNRRRTRLANLLRQLRKMQQTQEIARGETALRPQDLPRYQFLSIVLLSVMLAV